MDPRPHATPLSTINVVTTCHPADAMRDTIRATDRLLGSVAAGLLDYRFARLKIDGSVHRAGMGAAAWACHPCPAYKAQWGVKTITQLIWRRGHTSGGRARIGESILMAPSDGPSGLAGSG